MQLRPVSHSTQANALKMKLQFFGFPVCFLPPNGLQGVLRPAVARCYGRIQTVNPGLQPLGKRFQIYIIYWYFHSGKKKIQEILRQAQNDKQASNPGAWGQSEGRPVRGLQ